MLANWKIEKLKSNHELRQITGTNAISLDVKVTAECNCQNFRTYRSCSCIKKPGIELALKIEGGTELKNDLKKVLFNKDLSDFIFEADEEEIPVNKFLLSARSPVFHKMFTSEFKEKTGTLHKLKLDFSYQAFKEMIRFIYVEEIENFDDYVYDLLHAADFYQIDCLKILCEKKLLAVLNNTNALVIFQKAHLFNCRDDLKKAAFAIIKEIFSIHQFNIPETFVDDPGAINELFTAKSMIEKILVKNN